MHIQSARAAINSEASPIPTASFLGAASAHPWPLRHLPSTVRGGFPSPAQDLPCEAFDLAAHLAPHPDTTFTLRVSGDSMRDAGIPHGSLIVVDRSVEPRHGHIVVACVDGEFTVKQLEQLPGRCRLLPANPAYPPIELNDAQELQIWGVVRASVLQHLPACL